MRIRLAIPDQHLTPQALNSALEAVTRTNERLLASGRYPTANEAIQRGVRWRPEPPGDEHFDLAPTVLGRGWGDCDDLAPYHAASLRATGEDPGARAVVRRSGKNRWHAYVRRSDGRTDDPSKRAGMGKGINGEGESAPQFAAAVRALQPFLQAPRVAFNLSPWRQGYAGRVDLPMGDAAALASNAWAPNPLAALLDSLRGAAVVGEACGADPRCVLRVAGVHDVLCGEYDPGDVVQALDYISPQVAGDVLGFLPALASAVPMAGGVLSSLFGGGGKAPAAPPGGGGGGGAPAGGATGRGGGSIYNPHGPYNPGAPIIVRF